MMRNFFILFGLLVSFSANADSNYRYLECNSAWNQMLVYRFEPNSGFLSWTSNIAPGGGTFTRNATWLEREADGIVEFLFDGGVVEVDSALFHEEVLSSNAYVFLNDGRREKYECIRR